MKAALVMGLVLAAALAGLAGILRHEHVAHAEHAAQDAYAAHEVAAHAHATLRAAK